MAEQPGVGKIPRGRDKGMNAGRQQGIQEFSRLPALINAKLGQTVMSNMGDPALVNRTGAFASSARVTSVSGGARGVANIDYTYNKDPYEVFEMGGRGRVPWATEGRDPRTVIEKSIREIAFEMALGALTTRRA